MRETRQSGSEGGVRLIPHPYPYPARKSSLQRGPHLACQPFGLRTMLEVFCQ